MKTMRMLAAGALLATISTTAFAEDVVIGVPNWASARGTAHILQVAIEDYLGLSVELQTGTNPIIFEGMDSGSMHVHPEVWLPNQQNLHDKFVMDRGSVTFNPHAVLSDQKICATKDTVARTGISAVVDLTNPEMAANFDTDGDGRGEIWIGAAGWASTNIEKIRAKSYGYDETMNLKELDETLALAEVDNAIAQSRNIVFYCYTPHHMFSLYDLVVLDEPAYDETMWEIHQPTDDPDWLENSTAPTAWDATYLHIFYARALESSHPEAADMLSKVNLTTEQVNAIVYALSIDGKDPSDFAREWVEANAEQVGSWLN